MSARVFELSARDLCPSNGDHVELLGSGHQHRFLCADLGRLHGMAASVAFKRPQTQGAREGGGLDQEIYLGHGDVVPILPQGATIWVRMETKAAPLVYDSTEALSELSSTAKYLDAKVRFWLAEDINELPWLSSGRLGIGDRVASFTASGSIPQSSSQTHLNSTHSSVTSSLSRGLVAAGLPLSLMMTLSGGASSVSSSVDFPMELILDSGVESRTWLYPGHGSVSVTAPLSRNLIDDAAPWTLATKRPASAVSGTRSYSLSVQLLVGYLPPSLVHRLAGTAAQNTTDYQSMLAWQSDGAHSAALQCLNSSSAGTWDFELYGYVPTERGGPVAMSAKTLSWGVGASDIQSQSFGSPHAFARGLFSTAPTSADIALAASIGG